MPEKFDDTFGCMFISFSLDLMCYGAGFLAVLQYFRHGYGSKDSVVIKAMALALGFLATVHVTTFIAWAYDDLISRFGAFERLDAMPRTALVQLLAIIFYHTHLDPSYQSDCFFLSGIGGTFSNLINTEKVTSLQAAATAACDLLITATLCCILNQKRTGIKTTDTLLDNLIILAINRGAVTSLAALFNLILFVWRPEAMILCCQFYVLSVVGGLNSRRSLRDDGRDAVTLPLESMSGSESSAAGSGGVQVSTSVMSWKDGSQLGSHKNTGTGIDKYLPSSVSL
ncbi:hypothetical protein DFS33DRAFT_1276867 [Desarmillaria ectypa]|nr:hypothetical protein DFS33DRAFT_1276867 [Desarmillaria ectypa]